MQTRRDFPKLAAMLQNKYGKTVREENISDWRRAVAGNLTSVFRRYDAKEPKLDFLDRDKFVVGIQQARCKEIPSNYKKLDAAEIEDINRNSSRSSFASHQEPGIRPACALPYELYVEGRLSADGTSFELRMTAANNVHGVNSAGAPFNVYLRNLSADAGLGMRAATYAGRPGDTLRQRFPLSMFADSKYSIELHAPNGFHRSFIGDAALRALAVRMEYEQRGAKLTGNMRVHLRNSGSEPLTVALEDVSYNAGAQTKTIKPGHEEAVVLHLKHSHGLYDFTVKTDDSEAEVRYAGRVETGRSGFSDPLMGGIA
jgi:phospholipase C